MRAKRGWAARARPGRGHGRRRHTAAATIYAYFRYANRIMRRLGATGASVVLRLSAFILLCIGVQICWSGALVLVGTLPAVGLRG